MTTSTNACADPVDGERQYDDWGAQVAPTILILIKLTEQVCDGRFDRPQQARRLAAGLPRIRAAGRGLV